MNKAKYILVLILTMMTGMTLVQAQTISPTSTETPARPDARMAWWREARFGMFVLPALKNRVSKAYLLADSHRTALKVSPQNDGVVLSLPELAPDAIASVVCLELAE